MNSAQSVTSAEVPSRAVTPEQMLRVDGISKAFGGLQAVDKVSFDVRRGGISALIGPNGAGKTTTFNLLTGFLRADSGRIYFDGSDITRMPPHKLAANGLVRTFQTAKMFPNMTVHEAVATAAMLKESRRVGEASAQGVLERLDIARLGSQTADSLSLPDRQMVELAKCIAMRPKMILLDEIMGGLNRAEAEGLVQTIRELVDEGVTILLVEHVMPIVMNLAEHIVVLEFGRLIGAGTPEEVVANPDVQRSYLGEAT